MTLWFVFALMTVAAIFAVLLPLGRSGRAQNQGSEVAVYKDQLAEIERDLAAGLIAAPEAEAARVEISRRLLAAAGERACIGADIEPQMAPRGGCAGACRPAARCDRRLHAARLAQAPGLSPGAARARGRVRHGAVARESRRAGRAASGKESDRRARLERARAGAGAARPLRRCGARLSQLAHLQWRELGAPGRSRRGDRGCRRRRGDRRGQDRIRARACA